MLSALGSVKAGWAWVRRDEKKKRGEERREERKKRREEKGGQWVPLPHEQTNSRFLVANV